MSTKLNVERSRNRNALPSRTSDGAAMTAHDTRRDVEADGARAEIARAHQFQPQLFAEFLAKAKSIVLERLSREGAASSSAESAPAHPTDLRRPAAAAASDCGS